jgi:transposase
MAVIVGVDAHKKSHTMVAIDDVGRRLGEKTVEATTDGNYEAVHWARKRFGIDLLWAVEDVRSVTARLERDLLDADQRVVRVPPNLTAKTRRSSRTPGKSDPIDALAVARVALREPDLPVACHTPATREVKLLIDRHDVLVRHRSAIVSRLQWRVHDLDPTYVIKSGALSWAPARRSLAEFLAHRPGIVAEIARDELSDLIALAPKIRAIDQRLTFLVRAAAPSLLKLHGCGIMTAARILGEAADVSRFRSEAAFARWAGVAPIPGWSGSTYGRQRAHPGGSRQVNAALHQIALIQIKAGGPAEDYYRRLVDTRGTHSAAMVRLKRRIVRTVFARLRKDHPLVPYSLILADLARRNAEWDQCLATFPRGKLRKRWGRAAAAARPPRLDIVGDLVAITDEWSAALAVAQAAAL